MTLTDAGAHHPLFAGLAIDEEPDKPEHVGRLVPVARYHSLGCANPPEQLQVLATTKTDLGDVAMAAYAPDGSCMGLQFHPESILSPKGPVLLNRCINFLTKGEC